MMIRFRVTATRPVYATAVRAAPGDRIKVRSLAGPEAPDGFVLASELGDAMRAIRTPTVQLGWDGSRLVVKDGDGNNVRVVALAR